MACYARKWQLAPQAVCWALLPGVAPQCLLKEPLHLCQGQVEICTVLIGQSAFQTLSHLSHIRLPSGRTSVNIERERKKAVWLSVCLSLCLSLVLPLSRDPSLSFAQCFFPCLLVARGTLYSIDFQITRKTYVYKQGQIHSKHLADILSLVCIIGTDVYPCADLNPGRRRARRD